MKYVKIISVVSTIYYLFILQDKTFGLKNKKGAKQQRFIQQVEKQVKSGGITARKVDDKKKDDKTKDDLGLIFKPVQKVEKGIYPGLLF